MGSTYSLHYCPGVLGGHTGNGSTYSLNKCPGVLGGDTCDGYQTNPKESHLIAVKRIFRKSNLGAYQLLRGKLVCWSAKKQQFVAMSSVEAEYVPIFCDNTSAIAISNNPVLQSRTKHIDIRYYFIRDHILKGDIKLHFIPTQYQLADIFTKALDEPTFKRLILELGPPFTDHMKAIFNIDVPVESQALTTSSKTDMKVPQGKKPGAQSELRGKQSLKHTSESKTEASKSKTGQSDKRTQFS
ncbi:hypothetical protein Tco_1146032 [Tanacetum coccineum]